MRARLAQRCASEGLTAPIEAPAKSISSRLSMNASILGWFSNSQLRTELFERVGVCRSVSRLHGVPSVEGTPLDGGNLLKNSYYPLLDRIGLPRLTFHALRHTAATLLLAAGNASQDRCRASWAFDAHGDAQRLHPRHATMQREAATTLDRVLGA